jgi:hypothetical protein
MTQPCPHVAAVPACPTELQPVPHRAGADDLAPELQGLSAQQLGVAQHLIIVHRLSAAAAAAAAQDWSR